MAHIFDGLGPRQLKQGRHPRSLRRSPMALEEGVLGLLGFQTEDSGSAVWDAARRLQTSDPCSWDLRLADFEPEDWQPVASVLGYPTCDDYNKSSI